MNKLSWEEGNDGFKSGWGAEWVSFTVPEGAFNALLDTSITRALSSVLTTTSELSRPSWIVRNDFVRTVFQRLTYPALGLHAFHSLFMNKRFATLTAFLRFENRPCQQASSARASQIRSGQFRR